MEVLDLNSVRGQQAVALNHYAIYSMLETKVIVTSPYVENNGLKAKDLSTASSVYLSCWVWPACHRVTGTILGEEKVFVPTLS